MFTADDARKGVCYQAELDEKIRQAVREHDGGHGRGSIRVYYDDPWAHSIGYELERRGFHSVDVPNFMIKGDVTFSWE